MSRNRNARGASNRRGRSDSQQVALIGTSLKEAELVRHKFEVAHPNRDRGIDLIVYRDQPGRPFVGVPLQIKATRGERFDPNKKYKKFAGLVFAYIWNIDKNPRFFLFTYREALGVLGDARKTKSWRKKGYS